MNLFMFFALISGALVVEALGLSKAGPLGLVAFAVGSLLFGLQAYAKPISVQLGLPGTLMATALLVTLSGLLGLALGAVLGGGWFDWLGRSAVGFATALVAYNLLHPRATAAT